MEVSLGALRELPPDLNYGRVVGLAACIAGSHCGQPHHSRVSPFHIVSASMSIGLPSSVFAPKRYPLYRAGERKTGILTAETDQCSAKP